MYFYRMVGIMMGVVTLLSGCSTQKPVTPSLRQEFAQPHEFPPKVREAERRSLHEVMIGIANKLAPERKMRIAVFPFPERGIGPTLLGEFVADKLMVALGDKPTVKIVERSRLDTIREEQGLGIELDDATAADIGNLAGAEAVVVGTLTNLGDGYWDLTLRLLGATDGAMLTTTDAQLRSSDLPPNLSGRRLQRSVSKPRQISSKPSSLLSNSSSSSLLLSPLPRLTPAEPSLPAEDEAENDSTTPIEKEGYVFVPGGCFLMGSGDGNRNEQPPHRACVDSFWIGKTEVSVTQYKACVLSGNCTTEGMTGNCNLGKRDRKDHPINCVDWEQAQMYCKWAMGRLPTEAEWEYAARGKDGRTYPWGDEAPNCDLANYRGCAGHTTPVGSKPAGASPYGALDMAGNVWEWVADWYAHYDASSSVENPQGPDTGSRRVERGGGWHDNAGYVRAASRYSHSPGDRNSFLGFRCVRTAP